MLHILPWPRLRMQEAKTMQGVLAPDGTQKEIKGIPKI
jgi:hypothetical protein